MAGTKLELRPCAPWGYTDWCGLVRKAVFGCDDGGKSHTIERLREFRWQGWIAGKVLASVTSCEIRGWGQGSDSQQGFRADSSGRHLYAGAAALAEWRGGNGKYSLADLEQEITKSQ